MVLYLLPVPIDEEANKRALERRHHENHASGDSLYELPNPVDGKTRKPFVGIPRKHFSEPRADPVVRYHPVLVYPPSRKEMEIEVVAQEIHPSIGDERETGEQDNQEEGRCLYDAFCFFHWEAPFLGYFIKGGVKPLALAMGI